VRVGLIWGLSAIIVFSAISGKQAHYLLPEMPALALLAAYLLAHDRAPDDAAARPWLLVAASLMAGVAVLALPLLPINGVASVAYGWGGLMIVAAVALLVPVPTVQARVVVLSLLSVALVATLHLAVRPLVNTRYDLGDVARYLKVREDAGQPIAHVGKYHGQFHFAGRLREPITVVGTNTSPSAGQFLATHPHGLVVATYYTLPVAPAGQTPLFTHPFRRMTIAVWPAGAVLENPGLERRR
jgi:hypothetical protein